MTNVTELGTGQNPHPCRENQPRAVTSKQSGGSSKGYARLPHGPASLLRTSPGKTRTSFRTAGTHTGRSLSARAPKRKQPECSSIIKRIDECDLSVLVKTECSLAMTIAKGRAKDGMGCTTWADPTE